jgi:hypothetical protein
LDTVSESYPSRDGTSAEVIKPIVQDSTLFEPYLAHYASQDDPHLCAHWEALKKFVNAERWLEAIPLLEHIRDTAPYFREEEINRLLGKARETGQGGAENATADS